MPVAQNAIHDMVWDVLRRTAPAAAMAYRPTLHDLSLHLPA
jgi:hypothetical protein